MPHLRLELSTTPSQTDLFARAFDITTQRALAACGFFYLTMPPKRKNETAAASSQKKPNVISSYFAKIPNVSVCIVLVQANADDNQAHSAATPADTSSSSSTDTAPMPVAPAASPLTPFAPAVQASNCQPLSPPAAQKECAQCTFLNHASLTQCEVCEAALHTAAGSPAASTPDREPLPKDNVELQPLAEEGSDADEELDGDDRRPPIPAARLLDLSAISSSSKSLCLRLALALQRALVTCSFLTPDHASTETQERRCSCTAQKKLNVISSYFSKIPKVSVCVIPA